LVILLQRTTKLGWAPDPGGPGSWFGKPIVENNLLVLVSSDSIVGVGEVGYDNT